MSLLDPQLPRQQFEQRKLSLQQVGRPRSHKLHKLTLTNCQQLICQRRNLFKWQRKAYDSRDIANERYDQQICSADPCDVAELEESKQADFNRRMVIIHRLNFSPAAMAGEQPDESLLQHFVQVASLGVLDAETVSSPSLKFSDTALSKQRRTALAKVMANMPWSLNSTIRSTPRLPGAPSSTLC